MGPDPSRWLRLFIHRQIAPNESFQLGVGVEIRILDPMLVADSFPLVPRRFPEGGPWGPLGSFLHETVWSFVPGSKRPKT